MKKYGNIRFNRRVVVALCLFVSALVVLFCGQTVRADDTTYTGSTMYSVIIKSGYPKKNEYYSNDYSQTINYTSSSPVYSFIAEEPVSDGSGKPFDKRFNLVIGFCSASEIHSDELSEISPVVMNGCYFYTDRIIGLDWQKEDNSSTDDDYITKMSGSKSDIFQLVNDVGFYQTISDYLKTGVKADGMIVGGSGYLPKTQAFSEIGCLDNVQMETYVTNKKELIDADENADLSKINQDKVIVYSSSTTSGIDLSKGGYRVQLYGSYAWQDKKGNIKSEDKGHKTFIKDWDAQDNIKGLDRSKYKWIDWKSANDKVEADKTSNAHKPNVFEKMTSYANYQYEPIWYLRIVSQDNKYGAWIKLYNSTNKGKYRSESVDDDDNAVPDSGGGYSKPKDTSEITGTGDTPEDAKNNVQKTEEKQDNKDIQDASGGSNSTFDELEEFTKGIGDVPKMIADIFSFLPSWCLEVVAIGFALLMILIVVKFIRG